MSQADLPTRLNEAIAHINAGRRAEGRAILVSLSQQYPNQEKLWLWMAASSETTEERIAALRQVLAINPRNEKARNALSQLTGEALPPVQAGQLAAQPRQPRMVAPTVEAILQAIVVFAAVVVVILVIGAVVGSVIQRSFTPPTLTNTPTITFTPSMTFTPSITPGGPTFTPIFQTLPPSWTPGPTSTLPPTFTPPPTFTALATFTPSTVPTERPTLTSVPTYTPGGPSDTPEPPTQAPTTPPTATKAITPSTGTAAATATHTPMPG